MPPPWPNLRLSQVGLFCIAQAHFEHFLNASSGSERCPKVHWTRSLRKWCCPNSHVWGGGTTSSLLFSDDVLLFIMMWMMGHLSHACQQHCPRPNMLTRSTKSSLPTLPQPLRSVKHHGRDKTEHLPRLFAATVSPTNLAASFPKNNALIATLHLCSGQKDIFQNHFFHDVPTGAGDF